MDKLVLELITLLQELLAAYQRLLAMAEARREAMRAYDIPALNRLLELENGELSRVAGLETRRKALLVRVAAILGKNVPANITEIARRCGEPQASRVLGLAAKLKVVVGTLDQANRINGKVSQAVINSIGKVLKAVTGVAQHAGLYLRNGRKATTKGIHLLDALA